MSSNQHELESFGFIHTMDIDPNPKEELHVNNVEYFHFFAEARNAYMQKVGCPGYDRETGLGYLAASNHCDYKVSLHSPDKIDVGVTVESVGKNSLKVAMKIFSRTQKAIAAEGYTVVVPYDFNNNRKTGISDIMKQLITTVDSSS